MEAYIPDSDSRKQAVVEFFAKSGQQFLPIMELLIDAKQQLHDFAHGVGVAAIEGLLELSASKLAGMPHPGKAAPAPADSVHGTVRATAIRRAWWSWARASSACSGRVCGRFPMRPAGRWRSSRRPMRRLKHDPKLAGRVMDVALGGGVSTRKYKKTLDQTADAVGISKSQVSRELKKAMTTALEQVQTRVIPGAEILAVFIDGFVVGSTHVIGAIGVKKDGTKMVLGVREGASENLTVVEALLVDLRDRGLTAEVPRLFILDGGKALRSAVDAVYGKNAAVQRCRNHKVRNVLDHLPDKQRAHAKLVLRAAFTLEDASKGIEKLQQYAADLERGGWSKCRGLPAAWSGGVVHRAGLGLAAGTAAVSGDHQPAGCRPLRHARTLAAREHLA